MVGGEVASVERAVKKTASSSSSSSKLNQSFARRFASFERCDRLQTEVAGRTRTQESQPHERWLLFGRHGWQSARRQRLSFEKNLAVVEWICAEKFTFFFRSGVGFSSLSLVNKEKGRSMAPSPAADAAATVLAPQQAAASSEKMMKKKSKNKKKNKEEEEAPTTPAATATAPAPASTANADDASASASAPPSTGKRSASKAGDELDDLFSTIKKRKAEVRDG